jgi:hypothetical protein
MSKAPKDKEVLSSAVLYRPSLTANPVALGALVEFVANDVWSVGLAMRQVIDPALVAALDQLSREMIEGRLAIIRGEIDDVLTLARRPGDVLHLLSARNGWAFNVTYPQPLQIVHDKADAKLAVERLTDKYVLLAYTRVIQRARIELPVSIIEKARTLIPYYHHSDATPSDLDPVPEMPPWMMPPIYWRVPIAGYA